MMLLSDCLAQAKNIFINHSIRKRAFPNAAIMVADIKRFRKHIQNYDLIRILSQNSMLSYRLVP